MMPCLNLARKKIMLKKINKINNKRKKITIVIY